MVSGPFLTLPTPITDSDRESGLFSIPCSVWEVFTAPSIREEGEDEIGLASTRIH